MLVKIPSGILNFAYCYRLVWKFYFIFHDLNGFFETEFTVTSIFLKMSKQFLATSNSLIKQMRNFDGNTQLATFHCKHFRWLNLMGKLGLIGFQRTYFRQPYFMQPHFYSQFLQQLLCLAMTEILPITRKILRLGTFCRKSAGELLLRGKLCTADFKTNTSNSQI